LERAVWIVHADAQARAALARMAGMPALTGAPRLEAFPPAPAPGAVLLHVPLAANDALAFAHAAAARHPRAHWLLLVDPGLDPHWVMAAFAGLRSTLLIAPAQPAALQQSLRRALAGGAPGIGARRQRDALVARFARTLGDLAIPEPVLDASGHLAITGERGTGKLLLARTLHALWDGDEGERAAFVLLAGDSNASAAQLEAQLAEAAERAERLAVCVEHPAQFTPAVQRELASWVELGPPGAPLDPTRLLWIFLRSEAFGTSAPLDETLAEICEVPALRIPPLREREGAALALAEQWLRQWYAAKNREPRALANEAQDAIARDPWPGNARELEAALRRAVMTPGEEPIAAHGLGLSSLGDETRGGLSDDALASESDAFAEEGEAFARERDAEFEALDEASARAALGEAREFATVSEELEETRGSEASEQRRAQLAARARIASQYPARPAQASAPARVLAPARATPASAEIRAAIPAPAQSRPAGVPISREPSRASREPSRAEAPAGTPAIAHEFAVPPLAPSLARPAPPRPDLRAFAEATARDLVPALQALRKSDDALGTNRLARRIARLEQFAALDPTAKARSEVAPLLGALLEERREELLAKRLLVLRELEAEATPVHGSEAALRFALGALLDALIEAAPERGDLYVAARPGSAGVRVELRLHGGGALGEDALDLMLAREVLAGLGARLRSETRGSDQALEIAFAPEPR
jgi:DNA-binding NtrC family response regulator